MKEDLSNKEYQFIREFFLLSKRLEFNPSKNYFSYYLEEHKDLLDKIIVLENHGYVMDITSTSTKKYRMTEEFVEMVLNS